MEKRKNFTESRRNSLSIDNSDNVHIYLMYDSFSENYKIGSSKYPKLRLKEMNKKNVNISIYWYSENLVIRSIEKELHQEFKSLKIHNDWFKLSEKDLTNIKNKSIFHRTDKRTENENENEISISSFEKSEKLLSEEPIVPEMAKEFKKIFPKYPVNEVKDFTACYDIAKMIGEEKNLNSVQILSEGREYVLKRWSEIIQFIKTDKWYSTRSLADISKEWQRLIQTINSNVKGNHYNTKPTFTDKVAENNRYFEQFGENGSSGEG
jgi:hypothetical protein